MPVLHEDHEEHAEIIDQIERLMLDLVKKIGHAAVHEYIPCWLQKPIDTLIDGSEDSTVVSFEYHDGEDEMFRSHTHA